MNPSRCRIITIGKVRKAWVQEGIELYLKRLPGLKIVELRDGNPEKEAESIRQTLRSDPNNCMRTLKALKLLCPERARMR